VRTVDHKAAVQSLATEKYVLGELSPAERDEFEEHLSDCQRCMEDLSTAEMFIANGRAVFAEHATAVPQKKNRWFSFMRWRPAPVLALSAALNVVLLGVIGYGLVAVIPPFESHLPELETAGLSETFAVRGPSRGDSQTFTVPRSTRYCVFRFDVPHEYAHYSYSIRPIHDGGLVSSRTGKLPVSSLLDIPSNTNTLNLTVRVASLKPGAYELQVVGSDGAGTKQIGKCVLSIVQ
jgi:Putative zinc-finger